MNETSDPSPSLSEKIKRLHEVFCHETGARLKVGIGEYNRERFWADYIKEGFTEADLILVARYLRKKILSGERNQGALRFGNLIERLDKFEEELSMARPEARKPIQTPRDRAMTELRPTVAEVTPEDTKITAVPAAVPVKELIDNLRRAAGMRVNQ